MNQALLEEMIRTREAEISMVADEQRLLALSKGQKAAGSINVWRKLMAILKAGKRWIPLGLPPIEERHVPRKSMVAERTE